MTFTTEELDAKIKELNSNWHTADVVSSLDWTDFWYEATPGDWAEIPEFGTLTVIEVLEPKVQVVEVDDGYVSWKVYTVFELDGREFMYSGTWDSWGGSTYEDLKEVRGTQKTVHVWEHI